MMRLLRKISLLLGPLLCLLILNCHSSRASISPEDSQTYIIHMRRNASHTDIKAKSSHYNTLLNGAKAFIGQHEMEEILHYVYEHVFEGFAARLTDAQAEYVRQLPGVLALYPDTLHELQTTRSADFLGLTQPTARLWPLSNGGEDVIIGMVDSGIWPERLSFSDAGLGPIPSRWKGKCEAGQEFDPSVHCNNKLIGARYFTRTPIDETENILSPRDSSGHGTHTAGTAAGSAVLNAGSTAGLAKGTAYGMAPKARIAVYKVCWSGGCSDSNILAAFDAAVADGVDIISISIGRALVRSDTQVREFSLDPKAIGAYNAVKRGIFVSASAGNAGPARRTVGNVAPWFTTVAAATQDRENQGNVLLGDGQVIIGRSTYDGTGMGNGGFPLIYARDAARYSNAVWNASVCQEGTLKSSHVAGKVILCDYYPGFSDSDREIEGAEGVIFANLEADGEALSMPDTPKRLPFTHVGYRARTAIMSYIQANPDSATATLLATKTKLGVQPAPEIAEFSSRGPIRYPFRWLKPDIAAPGVDILAAGIDDGVTDEEFTFKSGTSMACPHISGLAASLKAIHRDWSPGMIKSALMTTATTQDNSPNKAITTEEHGARALPIHYGAGFVQPERAINPGLVYDMNHTDYLNFLCAVKYSHSELQLVDSSAPPCPLTPLRVEDTNLPSFYAIFSTASVAADPAISFARVVTNVETTGGTYTATVLNAPAQYTFSVVPRTLTFASKGQRRSFTLTVRAAITTPPATPIMSAVLVWSDGVHNVQSPIVMEF